MNFKREIQQLWMRMIYMTLNFQRLETEVGELGSVVDGVVLLLTTLAQEIRDNSANQAKIEEIATGIDTKANALAAAAAANTPADPAPAKARR